MTQNEIIEMARQAGGIDLSTIHGGGVRVWLGTDRTEFFETLIKLAVAQEREACALLAEKLIADEYFDVATEIRARGQA
jgi:hypothetical protein